MHYDGSFIKYVCYSFTEDDFVCSDVFILNAMRTVIFKELKHRSVKFFSDEEHKNDHGRCGYDM